MAQGTPSPGRRGDNELIEACLAGADDAWRELVERYAALVYSIARRSGIPSGDVDDAAQNVFLIVLRHLSTLRDRDWLASWLITTTHRECWRLMRRIPDHDELDDAIPDETEPPSSAFLEWERAQEVRHALCRLDDRCRDLLTALFLDPDEPSYEAVARRLGIPVGSVGPTRARCFKKLERILIEHGLGALDRVGGTHSA